MVSASASASDSTLARTRNGHELAVFGSVLAGSAGATADEGVVVDGTGSADAGAAAAGTRAVVAGTCAAAAEAAARGAAAAAATVALTSFSVRTRGGFDVMMVALSRSPSRKSVSCAGLPSRIIF